MVVVAANPRQHLRTRQPSALETANHDSRPPAQVRGRECPRAGNEPEPSASFPRHGLPGMKGIPHFFFLPVHENNHVRAGRARRKLAPALEPGRTRCSAALGPFLPARESRAKRRPSWRTVRLRFQDKRRKSSKKKIRRLSATGCFFGQEHCLPTPGNGRWGRPPKLVVLVFEAFPARPLPLPGLTSAPVLATRSLSWRIAANGTTAVMGVRPQKARSAPAIGAGAGQPFHNRRKQSNVFWSRPSFFRMLPFVLRNVPMSVNEIEIWTGPGLGNFFCVRVFSVVIGDLFGVITEHGKSELVYELRCFMYCKTCRPLGSLITSNSVEGEFVPVWWCTTTCGVFFYQSIQKP